MACPTLWMFWDAVASDCTTCPAMAGLATGSGATGSEGVKFNTAISLTLGSLPCSGNYLITSGPNAAYGYALTSVGSSPDLWTLIAHPALGPAYYALLSFTFNCALGWSGQVFNLPATGASGNATGTLTISFT